MGIEDGRTAALALEELLYLQPPAAPWVPRAVANKRRLQRIRLEQLRSERGSTQPSAPMGSRGGARSNPVGVYLVAGPDALRRPAVGRTSPAGEGDGDADGGDDATSGSGGGGGVASGAEGEAGATDRPAADPLSRQMDAIFTQGYAEPRGDAGDE